MFITTDLEFKNHARQLSPLVFYSNLSAVPSSQYLDVRGIAVRLGVNLDAENLSRFPNIQFIASVTTGLDHIDLAYCEKKNIKVISLAGEKEFLRGIVATPEHTWGLILSLIRKIPWAFDSVRQGHWNRTDFFGTELKNSTIGIIGFGRVGQRLLRYAKAFEMQVLAYDISTSGVKDDAKDVMFTSLQTLLEHSSIICLCVNYTLGNHLFLNQSHFELMKQRPLFINTARGRLVDEISLLKALSNGQISGAALDVLFSETQFKDGQIDSSLLKYAQTHQNLIITPHIAGSTHTSMKETALFIEEKILSFVFP